MAGDASWNSVSLLLHFDGSDGSAAITDKSSSPKTVSVFSGAKLSTAQSKFGGSALLLNGTSDYIQVPNTNMYPATLAEDFTAEAWIYITAYGAATMRLAGIADSGGGEMWSFGVTSSGTLYFNVYDGSFRSAGGGAAIPLNQWVHLAAVKSGANVYAFTNGVRGPTVGAMTANPVFSNNPLSIGRMGNYAGQYFAGRVDDFRITKGVARYTVDFTPPVAAFPDGLGQVSGVVTDPTNSPAARTVRAYRRDTGALVANVTSDATTGAYSFYTPTLDELTVLALDSASSAPLYDDVCLRVIPA